MNSSPSISRVILYVHRMPDVSAFYQTYFDFREAALDVIDVIQLISPAGGCAITLLQASKGQKSGQSLVKLVFDVPDIEAFKQTSAERGLYFGTTHHGVGYAFANARDPANNLIQISSRRLPND